MKCDSWTTIVHRKGKMQMQIAVHGDPETMSLTEFLSLFPQTTNTGGKCISFCFVSMLSRLPLRDSSGWRGALIETLEM